MRAALAAAAFSAVLKVAVATAVVLGLLAGVVLGLGDGSLFVSPPEAVAEQFVRKLGSRRWAPARHHLTPELAAALDEAALRASADAFEERWGPIQAVEGRRGPRSGDQAWASAEVTTTRHQGLPVAIPLLRRSGEWRVAGIHNFR